MVYLKVTFGDVYLCNLGNLRRCIFGRYYILMFHTPYDRYNAVSVINIFRF